MTPLRIVEFNDPGCPFGYSAEVHRRRIAWRYGDQIEMPLRLVGLHEDAESQARRGFTIEKARASWRRFADQWGMPFSFSPQRHVATVPACRAVVAARVHGADDRLLMRWLRIKRFSGESIDEQPVIAAAAREAGIDGDALHAWMNDAATERELAADLAAARDPAAAAIVVAHRLKKEAEGFRYTCPSWEIGTGDGLFAAPGFQPYDVYEVALANALPAARLREPAQDAGAVLEWAGEPLATREVALLMDVSDEQAAERLSATGAREIELESSSFWQAR